MTAKKKQAEATGLSVREPEMVPVAKINEAPYNPRHMSAEMMRALKASLVEHGMVLNLVVQRKGMVLIGGHQRLTAMRELCIEREWEEPKVVPTVVLDVNDATARRLNVALNRIDGEFDPYRLGEVFQTMREDLTLDQILATGFTAEEVDSSIALIMTPEEEASALENDAREMELGGFGKSITLTIECSTVEERDLLKAALKVACADGRKPGRVVTDALASIKIADKGRRVGKKTSA